MEKSSKKAEKGNIMEKSSKKAEKGIYGIYGKIRALIMTYLNHFTKFCILSPLKSKRAEE
ncbi:hypothetical protein T05_12585, partial [Trichinella murrelli]